jgi:hypothetical protein
MKLENWSVVYGPWDGYKAPEQITSHLYGFVYGNPKFVDGIDITTSAIRGQRDGRIVTQSGTEYELGATDPIYETKFPDARQRLFNSLKVL